MVIDVLLDFYSILCFCDAWEDPHKIKNAENPPVGVVSANKRVGPLRAP
jgi:hypothetical protein